MIDIDQYHDETGLTVFKLKFDQSSMVQRRHLPNIKTILDALQEAVRACDREEAQSRMGSAAESNLRDEMNKTLAKIAFVDHETDPAVRQARAQEAALNRQQQAENDRRRGLETPMQILERQRQQAKHDMRYVHGISPEPPPL